jgi:hypothetical protein
VKSIGIQFADGTVRMYLNEPAVELEIGKLDNTCLYRVKINGDTMECREIAKLIVDNWVVSYPDPYIKIPSVRNKDELRIWRSKLGLTAFSDICRVVSDNANDMIDLFSKAELKSDDEIEKAKRVIEMQVAKEMHEIKKNQPEEESGDVEDADTYLSKKGYSVDYLGDKKYYPGKYSISDKDPFKTYDEWKKW